MPDAATRATTFTTSSPGGGATAGPGGPRGGAATRTPADGPPSTRPHYKAATSSRAVVNKRNNLGARSGTTAQGRSQAHGPATS